MQVWTSKTTMKKGVAKVSILVVFLFLTSCEDIGFTDIQYENRSNEAIRVSVKGIVPNPSGGFLPPGTGSDELLEVSLHFGDSVQFSDIIILEWTNEDGSNKRTQELKRNDLKIPAVVRGGEIRFIYSAKGEWTIKYK